MIIQAKIKNPKKVQSNLLKGFAFYNLKKPYSVLIKDKTVRVYVGR